jgi:hypothetical protein
VCSPASIQDIVHAFFEVVCLFFQDRETLPRNRFFGVLRAKMRSSHKRPITLYLRLQRSQQVIYHVIILPIQSSSDVGKTT